MSTETITIERAERIAVVTLNRPDRMNAYNDQMGTELFSAFAELDADHDVRAIVVTGAGKHFCAGADMESGGDTFSRDDAWAKPGELERKVRPWNMNTPIIAAINGAAVGIGATLPLQWDIRIAADDAKIGFVFTRRGISPEATSTWILPRLIGMSRSLDILITGRFIRAEEAMSIGLVSRVVPRASLIDEARQIALDIANNTAPVSVAVTKRLLWRQLIEADPRDGKRIEDDVFFWIGKQPDAAEGVQSFLEKRPPSWTMSPGDLPDSVSDLKE